MSINFDGLLRDHSGARFGFFSPLRCDRIAAGLYEGLYVASTDAGELTQIQTGRATRAGCEGMAGYGTAFDRDVAIRRAVGEAVERYACVMFPGPEAVRRTSYSALRRHALHPDRFPRTAPEERALWPAHIGLREAGPDTVLDWVDAWSVSRGREVLLPLDMAYIGRDVPITDLVAAPISTGFAAGPDMAFAVQSGLQEVVERDAVALWWWGRRQVPHLDPAHWACDTARRFIGRAAAQGTRTILLDLTTDIGLPVVGALQLSPVWPHAVFMSACRPSRRAAILRAIEELGSVRQALAHTTQQVDEAALLAGRPHDPVAFALYHAARPDHAAFDFCLTPGAQRPAPPVGDLAAAIRRLEALGHEVIMVDCTKPDIAALGFVAVRVVVPGLMGLSFCHALRFLGEPRFRAVTGLGAHDNPMEHCNHDPLPFA